MQKNMFLVIIDLTYIQYGHLCFVIYECRIICMTNISMKSNHFLLIKSEILDGVACNVKKRIPNVFI